VPPTIRRYSHFLKYATGNDEVRPVSGVASNPFQNWGASIIDSLETLLIMGLTEEYNLCRKHINMVDFRLVNGRDWAYGYRPSPEVMEDLDAPEWTKQNQKAGREAHAHIASFEMGIRYLGGLIGAYDLSGDSLLLERAKELARILGKGFDTPSGLVLGRFDAGSEHDWYNSGRVSLAEVGSMTLEMTRLSQLTGDRWYFDRVQRAIDYLEEVVVPRSTMTPLLPLFFDSQIERTNLQVQGEFGYGAMGALNGTAFCVCITHDSTRCS
jgi:mannosyl-oligosaccharide alpha-1,2-mannosidase